MNTQANEVIDLPLFDLQYNKNVKKIKHYFLFAPKQLVFIIECYMDIHPKPDDDDTFTIKTDQYVNQVDHIKKDSIFWIKSSFNNDREVWTLEIFYGNQDTYCNFETEQEMRSVEVKLLKWWRA